ncbi:hypothetical protein Sjap_003911 [Stephania japonica]|uniref:Glycosyltransferase 2-like domain-containing protein n=1 Tax=Stephania japonica TaxID=461633 RepID=A0AAP0PXN0_9MAGN
MELLWWIAELLLVPALIVILGFVVGVSFEAFKRRRRDEIYESHPVIEDPNSLKQVPCPSVFDPAEKYMSLIIPAYNEEHRLSGALDETMSYLQQRAAKDKSFSYEVLIVDDGSSDGTSRIAFDFVRRYSVDKVRVILLGRNCGKGEAIRKRCKTGNASFTW